MLNVVLLTVVSKIKISKVFLKYYMPTVRIIFDTTSILSIGVCDLSYRYQLKYLRTNIVNNGTKIFYYVVVVVVTAAVGGGGS